jgi:YD repeat-containing protein
VLPLGQTYLYTYDARGYDEATDPEGTSRCSYDTFGRVTSVIDTNGSTSFLYAGTALADAILFRGSRVSLQFDAYQRVIGITDEQPHDGSSGTRQGVS